MELREYFETHNGTGFLATADSQGRVDTAIFARPHVLEEGLAFIVPDGRTRSNLLSNPHASYLFVQDAVEGGKRYVGKRLYLERKSEEMDTERARSLRRRTSSKDQSPRFLVIFDLVEERPLVGD